MPAAITPQALLFSVYFLNRVPKSPRPSEAPRFPPSVLPNFPKPFPICLPTSRPIVPVTVFPTDETARFLACAFFASSRAFSFSSAAAAFSFSRNSFLSSSAFSFSAASCAS